MTIQKLTARTWPQTRAYENVKTHGVYSAMTGVPKTMQKLTARIRPQRACVRHCKNSWRVLGHKERAYDNAKTDGAYSATTGVRQCKN